MSVPSTQLDVMETTLSTMVFVESIDVSCTVRRSFTPRDGTSLVRLASHQYRCGLRETAEPLMQERVVKNRLESYPGVPK